MQTLATAVLYARVSMSGGQDTQNQLLQLRTYCKRQGWKIVHEYIDTASGKRSDNRAQFQALLDAASRREFDVVLVWALDRFSREGVMKTFEHIKKLRTYRVEFESFSEPHFRTTGGAGELMIAIAAWIAEQERNRIVERTKAGLARARREGKTLGRPRKVLDRDKARRLHKQGLGVRAIAAKMGVSHMTVHRIVTM